jgi:hypothetical protein
MDEINNNIINGEENIKIIYIYRNDALKKAQLKYRQNNQDKIKEITKRYYDKVKNTEEFKNKVKLNKQVYYQNNKEKVLSKSKENYYSKKEKKSIEI